MTAVDDSTALARVRTALTRALLPGFDLTADVRPMPGGASTRKFFRVTSPEGALVAMFVPAPSQEINKARQAQTTAPFVEVHGLLEAAEVRVPRLLAHDPELQILLVEDLGDDTLAEFLKRYPDERVGLYRSAVRALAKTQDRLRDLPEASVVRRRAFDQELLSWEMDHFLEYALLERGLVPTASDVTIFEQARDALATEIASWPRVFVHRDYQSRNLMVPLGDTGQSARELVWIDFQDAMLGPRVYDLVALLTDSYQAFERPFILERLQDYADASGRPDDFEQIQREFDLVTVQRKLKDAGRFVFLNKVNGMPHFLPYVEPTIDKVFAALERLTGFEHLAALHEMLARVTGRPRTAIAG